MAAASQMFSENSLLVAAIALAQPKRSAREAGAIGSARQDSQPTESLSDHVGQLSASADIAGVARAVMALAKTLARAHPFCAALATAEPFTASAR